MPKRTVEQINIYPAKGLWITCAWIVVDQQGGYRDARTYIKEREAHLDFSTAVKYVQNNYVGVSWTGER